MGQAFMVCCGKALCYIQSKLEGSIPTCPFCRTKIPYLIDCLDMIEKQVDVGDSDAIYQLAMAHVDGLYELEKSVVKLFHRAVELESASAYHNLGWMYDKGDVVNKDKTKAIQYFERAAMRGSAKSRFNLVCY